MFFLNEIIVNVLVVVLDISAKWIVNCFQDLKTVFSKCVRLKKCVEREILLFLWLERNCVIVKHLFI